MKKTIICAALAGLMTAAAANSAGAVKSVAPSDMAKCYGIARAGQNDCKSTNGSHDCAGKTAANRDPHDFRYIDPNECPLSGGSLTPPK